MKTFDASLAAHYASGGTKFTYCLLVTRTDGVTFGFTSTDRPISYLGQTYEPWLNVSAIAQNAGLAVNNLETTVLYEEMFNKADFLAGRWDGAAWELFEINWSSPEDGVNTIGKYITGDVQPGRNACTVELRALSQFLQQPINIVTSKTCRARFADFPQPIANARCRLTAATYTTTGTATSSSSQQQMVDTSRTELDDWFSEGVLTFTSGENDGLSQKVKVYEASSVGTSFFFSLPFPFPIGTGDTYSVIAGCRKRLEEDCRDKFDNVLNFQGEPHLPGIDQATARPEVSV
jgi:uncharacterized phage protein (TIGR02218 family)